VWRTRDVVVTGWVWWCGCMASSFLIFRRTSPGSARGT